MADNTIKTEIKLKLSEPVAVKDTTIEALGIDESQILDLTEENINGSQAS